MDAVTLKTLLLDSIKKNIGVNFTFTEEGESLLKAAASEAADKQRAVLIINALNVTDSGQVEDKYHPEYYVGDLVEDLYDEDDPEESILSKPELNKFEEHHVIDVEFENHLPVSITFTELVCPVTSVAFMGVIKKVFFGDKEDWVYDPDDFKEQRYCLDKLGVRIPESVFQYIYFHHYATGYCSIFEYSLSGNCIGLNSYLTYTMNKLRCVNERSVNTKNNNATSYPDLDDETKRDLLTFLIEEQFAQVTEKNIELCREEAGRGALFYNKRLDSFAGFFWSDEDGVVMYRSLPDYVNTELSSELEDFLLLASFRTYVEVNKVTVNDGLDYLQDSDEGGISLANFVCDGVSFNSGEEESRYYIGWLNKIIIPWEM